MTTTISAEKGTYPRINTNSPSMHIRIHSMGREAFLNGDDIYACPYKGWGFDVWVSGYNFEKEMH